MSQLVAMDTRLENETGRNNYNQGNMHGDGCLRGRDVGRAEEHGCVEGGT